ncbi:ABC transporter ATP-binding protein [Azorhizobium caulinodans ORS 571]|uniref:ABC transporter ATP-binding protein n=1 Tax=Azorhizobium caulinodans (strain ATCC 43989 / DSM 5975 / JCM 20966 / LMG 6465 / NBRC 14845 / NCIMB 13405 / ORS 571) TaxID=438753 RepID=A8ICD4_AZOC5|nr:ABC transporter ATP-binding protein [Azorhizobium caulinodans]BAF89192.1 ABC transporter ATP-binding protein [Azorhizobium caulinodans ORS 571]
MSTPILALEGLMKSYGAMQVTRDVSLDVRPGEVHALIGPNGAGKTTLIAQIAGSITPNAGRIRFDGADVTDIGIAARARRGLGRVFQISNVVGSFTALENVAVAAIAAGDGPFRFWRRALADRKLTARAESALERVGLGNRRLTLARDMSHGERRALELAMSLVQEPKLLLLDEPMAGTGRAEGERLTELLLSLKGRIPILLVEHDMATVFRLADRISVLIYGAIAVTGDPATVRTDPLVRQAYLGEEEAV